MAKKTEATPPSVIELIEKKHGEGAVMLGGTTVHVEVVPTEVPSVDLALGCGGLPRGRIIEIFGPESSGKTTFCLRCLAAYQGHHFEDKERNGVVGFIDAEHAIDPIWARNNGVDMDSVLLSQPNSGEEALDIVEIMVDSRQVDLIIVDSVASLVPQEELDKGVDENTIGAQARLLSRAMRRLSGKVAKTKATVIFINQIRTKIGVTFGNPETTPGGRALKFYASVRLDIRRMAAVKDKEEVIAHAAKIKIVKNKVAPPFREAEFDICYGDPRRPVYGIDIHRSLLGVALDAKILSLKGSHVRYGDLILGNGLANAARFLRENPDLAKEIKAQTYSGSISSVAVGDELAEQVSTDDGTTAGFEEE